MLLPPAPKSGAANERRAHEAAALGVVALLATLVTVWWSCPAVRRWDTTVAYATVVGILGTLQHADFHLNAWTITWVSHALATHPAALYDGNAFYPAKLSVAYSESMLGYVPLFAPVYWATGNPVLALNVMAALTYPLAVACTYLLARLWGLGGRQHLAEPHNHQEAGGAPIGKEMVEGKVEPTAHGRGITEIDDEMDKDHAHQCKAAEHIDRPDPIHFSSPQCFQASAGSLLSACLLWNSLRRT